MDEGVAGELALAQWVAFGIVCHEVKAVFADVNMGTVISMSYLTSNKKPHLAGRVRWYEWVWGPPPRRFRD